MKGIILMLALAVGSSVGQRSPYASRGSSYPSVLPQYLSNNNNANANANANTNANNDAGNVASRLDDGASVRSSTTAAPTTTVTSLPGSLHDQQLIDRVAEWPRDRQPFWYVNNKLLAEHRGYTSTQPPVLARSLFQQARAPNNF